MKHSIDNHGKAKRAADDATREQYGDDAVPYTPDSGAHSCWLRHYELAMRVLEDPVRPSGDWWRKIRIRIAQYVAPKGFRVVGWWELSPVEGSKMVRWWCYDCQREVAAHGNLFCAECDGDLIVPLVTDNGG